ncbi:hypothetical protein GQX74_005393 [Glossina fuscipes]|nr:hypothetical protein GQX74_005393 [Glossina fuscipes]
MDETPLSSSYHLLDSSSLKWWPPFAYFHLFKAAVLLLLISRRMQQPSIQPTSKISPKTTTTMPPKSGPKSSDVSRSERASEQTVSIQNLHFPTTCESKGVFIVHQKEQKEAFEKISSKSDHGQKIRGIDLSTSTNSHFDHMILSVPKKFRAKSCGSSSIKSVDIRSETLTTPHHSTTETKRNKLTSEAMIDTEHKSSHKPEDFHGPEWKRPCKESFVAGAPRKFVGTCPHNYELLSKMSLPKQKFFLTQDPRKVHCLVNPDVLRTKAYSKKKEFDALTKMVKHAQNVCVAAASESSESFVCEVIDLENPLNLDFQGLDYANTYQKDEQDLQNQRNYRRVCRHLERKRVKEETAERVEHELHRQRLDIPPRYAVRDRNVVPPPPVSEEPFKLGKLFRAGDKPYNKMLVKQERERRSERYKDLYLKNRQRMLKNEEKDEHKKAKEGKQYGMTLAERNFRSFKDQIENAIERSFKTEMLLKKPEVQRRIFPHTIRETKIFKRDLKAHDRMLRDEARVKRDFYIQYVGKEKNYPEADLEISSDSALSHVSRLTEQSSDDEDDMVVGKEGNVFKLRGFHFKLGDTVRGKFHQREKQQGIRKEKGCITREQWLGELVPKKEKVRVDVDVGIQKLRSPDDPNLDLFPPKYGMKVPVVKQSAIKEFRDKPLGRHYERVIRKSLKFIKPRLRYRVKKFDLISYRFGDVAKRLAQIKGPLPDLNTRHLGLKTTAEYIQAKAEIERRRQMDIKEKRLKLLGIPCKFVRKSSLQTKCENSESSSDSEWVPEREPDYDAEMDEVQRKVEREKFLAKIRPIRLRTNMPAPKYREPTLRQHPRRRRDYENLRVPSEIFDDVVQTTNVPHMSHLPQDHINYANVALSKRPFTDLFNVRHHHDHWDPTQIKRVDVHYKAKVVRPEITKTKEKDENGTAETFDMANPPCNAYVSMDLTLPKWDISRLIAEHNQSSKKKTDVLDRIKHKDVCDLKDKVFRSRDSQELKSLDYPGRQEYLQFLHDIKTVVQDNKKSEDAGERLFVDRVALIRELEEDLQSIETCLTSLSSSECTNFTNDSGSFLLMEGKEKIPLDYIRKSLVPFEELHRSRFKAEPIDVSKEGTNPWVVLPFSGQKKAQAELITPKDSFFTFNTRLKNGLRLRLEVPVEDVREKLLGRGENKYKGVVATDIDENYVDELKNRPPIKMYKFKSSHTFIKDALRLKFECMLIQGQIVRTKIYDRLNEQHWADMQRVNILYKKLFAKWGKREYEASMGVVYKVKSYYDQTDRLKAEFRELERQSVILNMDIVFIEGHWITCIMLQNFHYLMADQEWRLEHDWIHIKKDENGECIELENYEESISKRSTVNMRVREKDDAWAIKAFYENVYLANKYPNLIVFPNADSFLRGIEHLKVKTFVLLLEMHFTLAIHTELQHRLETFQEWCVDDLTEKEEYVDRKCAKLYFMEDRASWLRTRTVNFLGEPIALSFNNETANKDRAVIWEVWREVVPPNMRGTGEQELQPIDMVAMISDVVMELIAKFENIPMDVSHKIENNLRTERAYREKQSYQAYHIERRIESEMKNVVKNLQPPYEKPKVIAKPPRYIIKKRRKLIEEPKPKVSERTKFFFRAFHGEDEVMQMTDVRESIAHVDNIQRQIVPFYFDHFLKLNGYTPNYNFKTQVELRDGPEVDRLAVQTIIPEVMTKLEQWQKRKRIIMEEHIAGNPKMYVDTEATSLYLLSASDLIWAFLFLFTSPGTVAMHPEVIFLKFVSPLYYSSNSYHEATKKLKDL